MTQTTTAEKKTRASYKPAKPGRCARCRREPVTKEGVLCAGCWPVIRVQFAQQYPKMQESDLDKQIRYILAGGL